MLQKFGKYRWIPTEPDFIDYPNAQFLMIGEGQDTLGKAATAGAEAKEPGEEEPGEELENLEEGNLERIEALGGMIASNTACLRDSNGATADAHVIYSDLGLDASNYPKVPTTWSF